MTVHANWTSRLFWLRVDQMIAAIEATKAKAATGAGTPRKRTT